MLKSVLKEEKTKTAKSYPKLMVSTKSGSVYIMTEDYCGTRVHLGPETSGFGEASCNLVSHCFEDFNGEIILSNG